jgi:hypothetical protein
MYQNCWAIDAVVERMTERAIREMSVTAVSLDHPWNVHACAGGREQLTTPSLTVIEMHEEQHDGRR